MQDSLSVFPNQNRLPYRFQYATGLAWSAALDYRFNRRLRAELELSGRNNDLAATSSGGSPPSGRLRTIAPMLNLYFDPIALAFGRWQPYLGAGIGASEVVLRKYRVNGSLLLDDQAHAFAYQFIAGVSYTFNPRWQGTLDYRYFATTDPLLTDAAGDTLRTSIRNHAFLLGIMCGFGRARG